MWLCDRGRNGVARWNDSSRVRRPQVRSDGRSTDVSPADAVREAARLLAGTKDRHGAGSIGVLASAECTNQEAWLLQRLAREVIGTEHIDPPLAPFAGIRP